MWQIDWTPQIFLRRHTLLHSLHCKALGLHGTRCNIVLFILCRVLKHWEKIIGPNCLILLLHMLIIMFEYLQYCFFYFASFPLRGADNFFSSGKLGILSVDISDVKWVLSRVCFVPKTKERKRPQQTNAKTFTLADTNIAWTELTSSISTSLNQYFYMSKLTSISTFPTSSISTLDNTRLHCYHRMVGRRVFFLWVLGLADLALLCRGGPDINRMTQSRYSNC